MDVVGTDDTGVVVEVVGLRGAAGRAAAGGALLVALFEVRATAGRRASTNDCEEGYDDKNRLESRISNSGKDPRHDGVPPRVITDDDAQP